MFASRWSRGRLLLFGAVFVGFGVWIARAVPQGSTASSPVARTEPWWVERHAEKIAEARRGGIDLLLIGDSITQNYEKAGPAPDEVFLPIWTEFFAPRRAMNLGFSGDETQHVLWRLEHGEVDGLTPHNVVLLIGTNNTAHGQSAEEVAAGVIAVVEAIEDRMPHAQVLVLGLLPSALSAKKSATDAWVNDAVARHYAGSPTVRTLDVGDLFRKDGRLQTELFYDPKLIPAHGSLHPNTVGQRLMAHAVWQALFAEHRKP